MQTIYWDNGHDVYLRRAGCGDFPAIRNLAQTYIGGEITPVSVMRRVWTHNTDVAWVIGRESSAELAGFYLFLFFNTEGLRAYEARAVDTLDPASSLLTSDGEKPAGIYLWAVVARGLTDRTFPLIIQALPKERYGGVPILARAVTPGGVHGLKRYGFGSENPSPARNAVGDKFRLNREPGRVGLVAREQRHGT
jgi:hypothetical protein